MPPSFPNDRPPGPPKSRCSRVANRTRQTHPAMKLSKSSTFLFPFLLGVVAATLVPAGHAAPRHRPANPRGVADPRGIADPRGVRDPRGVADPRGVRDPRGVADPRGIADPRGVFDPRG